MTATAKFLMNFKTGEYWDGASSVSAGDVLADTSLIEADGFKLDTNSSGGGTLYTTIIGNIRDYLLANPNLVLIGRITSVDAIPGSGTSTYQVIRIGDAVNPDPTTDPTYGLIFAQTHHTFSWLGLGGEERIHGGSYRTCSGYGPDAVSGTNVMQFIYHQAADRVELFINNLQDTGFQTIAARSGTPVPTTVFLGGVSGSNPPLSYPLHLEFLGAYDPADLTGADMLAMSDSSFTPAMPTPAPTPTTAQSYKVDGFSWSQATAKQILEPLLTVFDVDARPHDFGVEFKPRGAEPDGAILSGKMVRNGEDALYTVTLTADTDLPRRVFLTFADIEADHQPNTAVAQRPADSVDSARELSIDMTNMVMHIDRGRQFTERFLRREWFGRAKIEGNVPPTELAMEPGDVKTLTLDDHSFTARLVKMVVRANGVIETVWRRDDPTLAQLSGNSGATTSGRPPSVLLNPGLTQGWVMDAPLFADVQDTPVPFVYIAAAPVNETESWFGADFLQSDIPDEDSFQAGWDSIAWDQGVYWGTATDALPDVDPATIDYGTVLTVEMAYGTLETITQDQMLANPTRNLAMIGDEIIQFQEAVLESAGTYTLSGFHRGMRGTERLIDSHVGGERFILLTNVVKQHALGASEIGDTDYYIPMSAGGSVDNYDMIALPFLAVAHRPYSPSHVVMTRDSGSGDWSFTWLRRTRIGGTSINGQNVPLGETSEAYAVKIMDGADVVRRIEVNDESATYTSAQQSSDFGSPQTSLTIQVVQINPLLGLDGFATQASA